MKVCDWTDLEERCLTLKVSLLDGKLASSPLTVLGLFDDPSLQRRCAELYSRSTLGSKASSRETIRWDRREKIRVGYFSMDFREHPVAHLIAELIECHDRDKFEVYGISFGVNTGDVMRKRLEGAFDKFLDVRHLSELDIARLSRELELDIAVDLGGHTQDSRPAIFAHRAAPIQINYLGFPGTMGVEHFDYFIGDRTTITEANLKCLSEKVIFLPNSFQANPSQRSAGLSRSSRAAHGLPEEGFVFCCFNNNWKITPRIFELWIGILKEVEGSVLWLYVDSVSARHHLEETFKFRGLVGGNRIVFASRCNLEAYFDRYRFADLFLDTYPYNAGTTAGDALWMGLPLLTLRGSSFAARMASSLLGTIGLTELITDTPLDYRSLAIELANNPERLASLKLKLAANRSTCQLFDTTLFARHLELAFQTIYDRHHAGLAPNHVYLNS